MENNKVVKIAKVVDNAIDDVTMEYAKEAGTKILDDGIHAATSMFCAYLYLGSAMMQASMLAVRAAKTGTKEAVLKAIEFYDGNSKTVIVRR